MTRKLTLIAACAAAAIGSTVPAFAQFNAFEPSSRIVRYDDLDLNNERGRERLETRIRTAANSACGFWQARTLSEKQAAEQCRETAMAKAKADAEAAKAQKTKQR